MSASHGPAWLKPVILLVFVGGLVLFFALGGHRLLSLEALQQHRELLLDYTERRYGLMLAAAIGVYALAVALSIPGAVVLSLAAGFLFGRWVGTVVILIGATLGATLLFLAARYLVADAVQRRLGGRMQKLVAGFRRDAFNYLLFLRLVPVFPFWLVNLAPAFTAVRLRTYVVATMIGIVPGSFVFANLGQSLGRIETLDQLLSLELAIALGLLGLLALLPVVVKRVRSPHSLGENT
ncbi:MAG TPA: TVP38/TMEM64 family protein [Longimicrobiaceae bacterium]|nr:TVP38/TMEM64 family protein [Longimicrobiaceae bacterium]